MGTYACLKWCVPISFRALRDAVFLLIDDVKEREREVWERTRMTMREFPERAEDMNVGLRPIRLHQLIHQRIAFAKAALAGAGPSSGIISRRSPRSMDRP